MKDLDLLDYFAGKAMQSLINHPTKDGFYLKGKNGVPIIARYAYEYAEAMMEERKDYIGDEDAGSN